MGAEAGAWRIAALAACIVPVAAGAGGVLHGPALLLHGAPLPPTHDLDSHFRYLSGLLLGLGLAFAWTILGIERRAAAFRLLGLIVICGGLARLLSLAMVGVPGAGHRFGLVMELGVVPLLMLWRRRIERRSARNS